MTQGLLDDDFDQFGIVDPAMPRLLGCRGTSRSDFRWDDEQGLEGLFLLETNTQPGMTPLSLVPEQAKHCGIEYAELVEIIIQDALRHFGKLPGDAA